MKISKLSQVLVRETSLISCEITEENAQFNSNRLKIEIELKLNEKYRCESENDTILPYYAAFHFTRNFESKKAS